MNLNATMLAQLVVFLVLALVTMKFVWPPLMKALDERAERIANGLAAADRGKAEMAKAEKHAQAQLAGARDEVQKRIADAEKAAAAIIEEAKKTASSEAARIVAAAHDDAQQQVTQAREQLRSQVAALAVKGAEQILKREVNAQVHADLLSKLATVASPYAEALFRVAQQGNLAAWSAVLEEAGQIGANSDVLAFARNPKVSGSQTVDAIASLVKSPMPPEARNFLDMLVANDRVTLLPIIAAQFKELKNAHEGAADATIVSAFEISPAQLAELVTTLEKKFGRKLNPTVTVDNSLIGGVRVEVGDEVLDTSVKAKLQQMQHALTA